MPLIHYRRSTRRTSLHIQISMSNFRAVNGGWGTGRFGESVWQPSGHATNAPPQSNRLTEEKPRLDSRYTEGDQWPRTTSEPARRGSVPADARHPNTPVIAASFPVGLRRGDAAGPAPIHLAFPDTIWPFPGRRRGAFSERAPQNTANRAAELRGHGSGVSGCSGGDDARQFFRPVAWRISAKSQSRNRRTRQTGHVILLI